MSTRMAVARSLDIGHRIARVSGAELARPCGRSEGAAQDGDQMPDRGSDPGKSAAVVRISWVNADRSESI